MMRCPLPGYAQLDLITRISIASLLPNGKSTDMKSGYVTSSAFSFNFRLVDVHSLVLFNVVREHITDDRSFLLGNLGCERYGSGK